MSFQIFPWEALKAAPLASGGARTGLSDRAAGLVITGHDRSSSQEALEGLGSTEVLGAAVRATWRTSRGQGGGPCPRRGFSTAAGGH